ncbi:Protein of unknown function [Streptomyces sp. Termitarium-T10T-6]|nr:Protein of unknown function [Streptomyces sp. Termitarium-T10T-6]
MRRRAGLVILAFAVFFAALSPLLRWYAFPRLAKIPPSQYQEVVLEAKPAVLLDYSTLKAKKVEKVTIVQTLKGNVEESEKIERSAGRDVVVWDALSYIEGPDGKTVSAIPERYIFDAHTQAPVNATGEMVDGDPVRREGIEFKWPFLTEKRDYQYFDAQTRTTAPIHYKGTRTFRGLEVYYFEQTIPWTKVPMPKKMPIEGITAEQIAQTGMTRWYTTKRMFWVDPVTRSPRQRRGDPPGRAPRRQEDGHVRGHRHRVLRPREDARGLHRGHRRPGEVPARPGPPPHLVPALGLPGTRHRTGRTRPVAGGAVPAAGESYERLSLAVVYRVAGTVAGSSGHGCFG